ncbi:MAG: polyprenyl synthetase family protein [Bacteroidota bacterium]|nr:polyprenyl synthetase family protein [Bacteroidota bacterium]
MYSIKYLQDKIKTEVEKLDFDLKPRLLYEPIAYTLSIGGKRLRPLLLLMSCDMFGGDLNDSINPSIGVEIFHNFTLIHDDIMDNAPIRRNKPTVYKKWNANIAILSGDVMFAKAYDYMLLTNPNALLNVIKTLNYVAIKVCEGQQYDMDYETEDNISIDDYINMIRLKTGVLIAGSLKLGALIAESSEKNAELIYQFGEKIGIAFQIQDDLLDAYSVNSKFGKSTGGDIVSNKKTFLLLKAFELADKNTLSELKDLMYKLKIDPEEKVQKVIAIYDKLDIKMTAIKEMKSYFDEGLRYLDMIDIKEDNKSNLRNFVNDLINREY